MTCSRAINSPDICPPSYPAQPLPAPGVLFADQDFGTPLLCVTSGGGQVNDSPIASMWSADSRFFYVRDGGGAFVFYEALKNNGKLVGIKKLSGPTYFYGFPAWDTLRARRFYVLTLRQVLRYDFTIVRGKMVLSAPTVEVDFSQVPNAPIPPADNGYPYGIFCVSPAHIIVTVSSTNGQETFDYLVVHDRRTNSTKVIDLKARIGWDEKRYRGTHGTLCDDLGRTAYMQLNASSPPWDTFAVAYDVQTDTFSQRWSSRDVGKPGGHVALGYRYLLGGRYDGGGWARMDLRKLSVVDPVCLFPRKNGFVQWCDQHASQMTARGFVSSFYTGPSLSYTWAPYQGVLWALVGFRAQWSLNVNDPEELRYKLTRVPNVGKIPDMPNGWWYDKATDTAYFWPADGGDPNGKVAIFDWFCFTDEIVRFIPDPSGDVTKPWTWERLLKHRCHNDPADTFYTIPKGNVSPDGHLVLFASNWDGSLPHTDVLLADIS